MLNMLLIIVLIVGVIGSGILLIRILRFAVSLTFIVLKSTSINIDTYIRWQQIESDLKARYKTYDDIISVRLPCEDGNGQTSEEDTAKTDNKHFYLSRRMIAVDLLIEKAQKELTKRAESYKTNGKFLFFLSSAIIIMFVLFLLFNEEVVEIFDNTLVWSNLIEKYELKTIDDARTLHALDALHFSLILIKRIVAGGAILGLAYLFSATANSCFRESTTLLHRRHLLRYVRLLSYENDGKIEKKDLRDIFGVDHAARTGFDRIKVETIRDNLIGKLIDAFGYRKDDIIKQVIEEIDKRDKDNENKDDKCRKD